MIQPTLSAMARATREQPSTTKKAIVFLRLVICTVSNRIVPRRSSGARGAAEVQEKQIPQRPAPAKVRREKKRETPLGMTTSALLCER